MILSFIVAASTNNVIGDKGQLPWSLPDDLKYFKNMTWGLPIIMGRKTYESFARVLKGRTNIVITRQADYPATVAIVARNITEAIEKASLLQTAEILIIGGGDLFQQTLPQASRIYLTRVHTTISGDAFFPEWNADEWQLVSERHHPADAKHAVDFSFQVWERKTAAT